MQKKGDSPRVTLQSPSSTHFHQSVVHSRLVHSSSRIFVYSDDFNRSILDCQFLSFIFSPQHPVVLLCSRLRDSRPSQPQHHLTSASHFPTSLGMARHLPLCLSANHRHHHRLQHSPRSSLPPHPQHKQSYTAPILAHPKSRQIRSTRGNPPFAFQPKE